MKISVLNFAFGALLSTSVAFAQEKPASKDVPPSAAPAPLAVKTNDARGVVGPGGRFERPGQEISIEQRGKLDEINKAYTATATPLYARLNTAKRELESVINQDQTDEAAVRAKAKEIAELETDLALARAKRFAQFRAFLSPEQARRFNTAIPINRPYQAPVRDGQPQPPISPAK